MEKAWWDGHRIVGLLANDLPANHYPAELSTVVAPRLIELCFQTAGVWELGVQSRMGLPRHIRQISFDRLPAPSDGRLYAVVTPDQDHGTFDAEVLDTKGNCYLRLTGYQTVPLPNAVNAAALKALHEVMSGDAALGGVRDATRLILNRFIGVRMQIEFQRVAIVNRGEPAMRFIHAARESSLEHGIPLRTIALFTEPDRHAMFVREADEAFSIGAAQFLDPEEQCAKSSYLDYKRLEQALAAARADAVWVGWGFVAEHAAFADLCQEMGIVFIGPTAEVMRKLGDKIAAKRLAEESQIAVAPWSNGPVETWPTLQRTRIAWDFPCSSRPRRAVGGTAFA